jgi:hypothetical protein
MQSDSSARLLISCGSLLLQTGAVPESLHGDAALVADVSQELASVRLGSPALAVSLARGETTATLLARLHELQPEFAGFREAMLSLGTVDLHDGLGMLASLGRAAAIVALDRDHLRSHIDKDLVIPLMRLRNGTLRRVAIWALNSLAGGVGALAGPLFAEAAAASVRELSQAVIDVLSFQVGALTFLGLGDRILDNAAAGLIEQLALLTDRDRDPRESHQLVLTELPTVDAMANEIGSNRALRSALAVSLASAFAASEVQQRIQAGRTNRALGLSLGGVTLLRGDWFGMMPADEVVASAARNYLEQFSAPDGLAATPPELEFLEAQTSSYSRTPAELAALAFESRSGKPLSFDTDAMAEAKFAVIVRLAGLPAEQASAQAFESALSSGHQQAMSRLTAISTAVRRALEAERVSESRETARAGARRGRLKEASTVLFPGGAAWASTWQFFAGPRHSVERFVAALNSWRESQMKLARSTARRSALETAASVIKSVIDRLASILTRLKLALEAIAGSAGRQCLAFLPMNDVSAGFLRCIVSGDLSLLRSQLARSARSITLEGLALMVKAGAPHAAEIVARLASEPAFSGPFWGGGEPSSPRFFKTIVLPPMHPSQMALLRSAAMEAGLPCELLAGDTLAGGAAVVGLETYEAASLAELFPAPYLLGLREIAGPKSDLYPLGANLTFALKGHFRRSGRRILFGFNGGAAERSQVKTLPLF